MDNLMDRYTTLNNRTSFNPDTYWQEWQKLAEDFDKEGRHVMAGGCYGKADWYRNARKGYAQKLSYTDITPVPVSGVVTQDERLLPCIPCQTTTKHVRLTDGWMCGCGEFVRCE